MGIYVWLNAIVSHLSPFRLPGSRRSWQATTGYCCISCQTPVYFGSCSLLSSSVEWLKVWQCCHDDCVRNVSICRCAVVNMIRRCVLGFFYIMVFFCGSFLRVRLWTKNVAESLLLNMVLIPLYRATSNRCFQQRFQNCFDDCGFEIIRRRRRSHCSITARQTFRRFHIIDVIVFMCFSCCLLLPAKELYQYAV